MLVFFNFLNCIFFLVNLFILIVVVIVAVVVLVVLVLVAVAVVLQSFICCSSLQIIMVSEQSVRVQIFSK